MNERPPKVVYDCMVFLQGLIKERGPAVECLALVENDSVELFISKVVLREISEVLTRPELQSRYPLLTSERVARLIEVMQRKAILIDPVPPIFSYSRDPKDEPYINLAVAAGADCIVSRDTDLLDLMTGYMAECKEFRQRFRLLKVIDPVSFLEAVGRQLQATANDEE